MAEPDRTDSVSLINITSLTESVDFEREKALILTKTRAIQFRQIYNSYSRI